MWTSTNGESIWSMARWRWRSSTAWSKERSSSRSKARLTAPLWPKPRTIRPERGSSQLLPYFCAHRRPERNPTPGSHSTAKLVPFFAATDTYRQGGLEYALHDEARPGQPRKYQTDEEAEVVALACSAPPGGRKRWTVRLLTAAARERPGLASVNRETVRQMLKKTTASPGAS